jgi:hypothetical protein
MECQIQGKKTDGQTKTGPQQICWFLLKTGCFIKPGPVGSASENRWLFKPWLDLDEVRLRLVDKLVYF